MHRSKVIIVDDEKGMLHSCQRLLRKEPFETLLTSSSEEALQWLAQPGVSVLLTDLKMPFMSGIDLIEKAKKISADIVCLILSGEADMHMALEAINRGTVYRFLTKPCHDEEFRLAIRQAVARHKDILKHKKTENSLRESEHRLKTILDAIDAGVVILDEKDQRIIDANPAAVRIMGGDRNQIIGAHHNQFVFHRENGRLPPIEPDHLPPPSEQVILTPEGQPMSILERLRPIILDGHHYILETFIDITERKLMEQLLEDSRKRYQDLVETVGDWIWEINPQGVFTFSNPQVASLLGYDLAALLDKTPFDFMIPAEAKRAKTLMQKCMTDGKPIPTFEAIFLHKNGRQVLLEISGVPFMSKNGVLLGCRGTSRDITDARQAKEKLRATELLLAEEHERRRIANHLHDRICQYLVGATMKLASLQEAGKTDPKTIRLREVSSLIEQGTRDIRLMISQLHPLEPNHSNLKTSIERLRKKMQSLFGLKINVRHEKLPETMDSQTVTVLFQCVRELLMNIAKHAKVREASVSIGQNNGFLQICVEDNGTGFDPAHLTQPPGTAGGYGLPSLPSRLKPLGGSFSIRSKPGRGTKATLAVPWPAKKHPANHEN
ncbi:MAG: PAS domain S-box protein [Verrucomicrobiae bacterium]|nr:PAS domain S-box protein [Verrucomicrobiae bacterium]